MAEESWVIDGNFSGTLELRAARADTIIVLDLPRRVCLWRVGKRVVTYWGRRRPDMAEGCPEHLDLKFLAWIWNYRAHTRPRVVARLEDSAASKTIVWLRSAREVEAYLASHEPVRAGR